MIVGLGPGRIVRKVMKAVHKNTLIMKPQNRYRQIYVLREKGAYLIGIGCDGPREA